MGYQIPDGTYVSASWQSHKNRNPPSSEPGTDYGCAYGTPLYAADPGTVYAVYGNTGPAGRVVEIRLDDGRTVRYLHLDSAQVSAGQRVKRGQRVATSGASGNGSNYFYGPHCHTTLLPTYTTPLSQSIDFAKYAGGSTPTPPTPTPAPESPGLEYPMFSIVPTTDGTIYCVSLITGKRTRIGSPGDVTLLQRVRDNNSSDKMITSEIDTAGRYMAKVNPAAAADPSDVPLTDEQITQLAEQIAAQLGDVGGASVEEVTQIVNDALESLTLVSDDGAES